MAHRRVPDRVRPPSPIPGSVLALALLWIGVGSGLGVLGTVTFVAFGVIAIVFVSVRYWFITRVFWRTHVVVQGTIVRLGREGVRTSPHVFDILLWVEGWGTGGDWMGWAGKPTLGKPVVLVEFGSVAGRARLRARISEDLYESLQEKEEWEIMYAESDPRFALLKGERMALF